MPSFYGENPPDTEVGTTDATESQVSEDAVTETDTSGGFYQGSPEQTTTEAYEADARAARDAALAAQEAAEDAQTAAEASESSASSSEANAASSESAAATSATNASNSASAAAGSATTAATQASNASSSATAAAASASAAASSESAAASSETAAASSQTAAAGSAAAAASSAGTASTKASEAATSATNAAASESAAASSESAAATSATQAAASATNAASSETAAASSETAAASSESAASTSASNAASSASAASSSATAAASSATAAASSATSAGTARDDAQAALDSFDDRYLGAKSSEPTVDNDGDALVAGALFFDTVNTVMKVYDGSQWLAAYASVSGALLAINNLDDVTNTATARSNLGLGTASEQNVTYFATAAQGALADSALQNGDNVSVLTNDAGYLVSDSDGSDLQNVRAETIEVNVKNVSGGSLAKGTPVHQTGTSGAATFEVVAADASSASLMPAHFVLLETLADEAEGRGLLMGRISEVDTSSFSEGDTIYVAAGGGFTNVAPTGEGNLIQNLGTVTRVDATNGGGEVMGAGRSAATPNLNNGNIFIGNASNQAVSASLSTSVSNAGFASTTYVDTAVANLVDSAPATLDTLNELAAALGDDANFSTTVTNSIATKWTQDNTKISNWDTAYGWGDHGAEGYLTGNQTITLTGDVSGSGTTSISVTIADDSHNHIIGNVDGLQAALDGKTAPPSSNDTFNGTYPLVWVASDVLYSSTFMTINGATDTLSVPNISISGTLNGGTPWHSANDGSGSGLDADLLDGVQATGFMRQLSDASSPNYTTPSSRRVDPNSSNPTNAHHAIVTFGNDGNVTGQLATHFVSGQPYTRGYNNAWSSWRTIWTDANDGSGSGLDADTVDGVQSSSFIRSDVADSFGAQLSSANNVAIRFVAPNATDENDGKIGAGTFASGLNIVGAQTSAGTGRQVRIWGDVITSGGNAFWHSGNDGSGSGLDADLLDGNHASAFLTSTNDRVYITDSRGAQRAPSYYDDKYVQWDFQNISDTGAGGDGWHVLQTVSPWSSYNDAHRQQQLVFTGSGGLKFRYASSDSAWTGWQTLWTSANDGSGSGLDADTCDGQHLGTGASVSFGKAQADGIGVTNTSSSSKIGISLYNGHAESTNPTYGIMFTGTSGSGTFGDVTGNWATYFTMNNSSGRGWIFRENSTGTNVASISNRGYLTAQRLYAGDGNDGFFYSDINGRTAFASGDFYIQPSVSNFYNYATNQYYGDSSGDNILFRGNTLSGNSWSLTGGGAFTTGGTIDVNGGFSGIDLTGSSIISSATSGWTGNPGANGKIQYHANRWYIVADSNSNRIVQFRQDGTDKSYIDNNGTLVGGGMWSSYNDGSGSGLDADTLDGIQGSQFLRGDSNDTLTANIEARGDFVGSVDGYRDHGVYGNYDSYRIHHMWSMGTAYRINANGTDFGNLYGFAYTYNNRVYTSNVMAGDHQIVWCIGGTPKAALGANIWTAGNVTAYSDRAVKTNLEVIPDALSKVCQINGYTYDRTDFKPDPETGETPNTRQAGVVAQEVEKVLPEVVSGEEGGKAVAYGNMVSLLIEAIKELKAEVDDLKAQLEEVK